MAAVERTWCGALTKSERQIDAADAGVIMVGIGKRRAEIGGINIDSGAAAWREGISGVAQSVGWIGRKVRWSVEGSTRVRYVMHAQRALDADSPTFFPA